MIVLSMITKNSLQKVGAQMFRRVWEASLQVPYKAVVLIDDSDDESTRRFVRQFAEEFGKEVLVERSRLYGWHKPTRATARQTAIDIFLESFSDEWLFFLDDDFILHRGWWEEAAPHTQDGRVGLIWGVDYTPLWEERLKWLQVRGASPADYSIQQFTVRGGLHDTLLRRVAIQGVKIPPWAHVYEDAWVKKYVECRGWEVRIVRTGGDHLRASAEGYTSKDLDVMIKLTARLGLEKITIKSLLKALFGLPAYTYYSWKAYRSLSRGVQIWWSRVYFRAKVLLESRPRDPCEYVRGASLNT